MDLLQLREKEIFETLKKIRKYTFVIISGYAVNAYVLPRFSVDCDIVIKDRKELENIQEILVKMGYYKVKNDSGVSYDGKFERYQKEIRQNFKVSMDILIGEVSDRETKSIFSAGWVFDNAMMRTLRGKTISEELKVRIVNSDALFVMKLSSCRATDIRDIFLLINLVKNKEWITKEVSERYDVKERLAKALKEITSKQFKDGLQGVFGFIDNKIFEKHKKMMLELNK